jgi:ABC-type uncharacterized transport system permease subunit
MKIVPKSIQPLNDKTSSKLNTRFASLVLILAALCFFAAFTLGFFNRSGLTQFVFAGSFLAMWATVVGTSNTRAHFPKPLLNAFILAKRISGSNERPK